MTIDLITFIETTFPSKILSSRFRRLFNLDYFQLICLFRCLSGLLDFCVSLIGVSMAIVQNFARCHLLQFRWLLILSQCLQGFVAGSALNYMFRNSRLKQPCRTSSSKSVVGSNRKTSFSCHHFHHCSQRVMTDYLL